MTQVLMRHHRTSREKQTKRVVLVGLFSPKTVPDLPVKDLTSSLEHMGVRGVTPVCHRNLKTYRTDYRERGRKTIPRRVDLVG